MYQRERVLLFSNIIDHAQNVKNSYSQRERGTKERERIMRKKRHGWPLKTAIAIEHCLRIRRRIQ